MNPEQLFRADFRPDFNVDALYGRLEIDVYALPPMIFITACNIRETLDMCKSKAERKHTAAAIILGQPFNFVREK